MTFTVENLEFYLLVLVRVSSLVMAAPLFGNQTIPVRIKVALSVFLSLIVITVTPVVTLEYAGVTGYAVLILKEMLLGITMGLMCNMCFYIVGFAGHLMDMEMGLSMASMFDPMTKTNVTITGNIYNYMLFLMMVITNMHYYIIRAIADSFSYFNVGRAVFPTVTIKTIAVDFIINYFVIAVRIILPIFCCMLLINVVLGVMARVAPQMNLFVVGMQLKIFAGLIILILIMQSFPTVSDYIFDEMKELLSNVMHAFTPSQ